MSVVEVIPSLLRDWLGEEVFPLFENLFNQNALQWSLEDQIRVAIDSRSLEEVLSLKVCIDESNLLRVGHINNLDLYFQERYKGTSAKWGAETLLESLGSTLDRVSIKLVKASKRPEKRNMELLGVDEMTIQLRRLEEKILWGEVDHRHNLIEKFYGEVGSGDCVK